MVTDDDDFNLDTNLDIEPAQQSVLCTRYDEAQNVSDDEEVPSVFELTSKKESVPNIVGQLKQNAKTWQRMVGPENDSDDEGEDEEEDDEDEDEDELGGNFTDDDEEQEMQFKGEYNPEDYANLPVSENCKTLFRAIQQYIPHDIEIDYFFKPFIPDYIPAIGDTDPMIKVPRPDGQPDKFGYAILDEPQPVQTDAAVLKLWLRMHNKQRSEEPGGEIVKTVAHDPKAIEHWIESISNLRRSQAPPNVHYSRNMPSVDSLMQEWPSEFENLLKQIGLPPAELDCDLAAYSDIICSLLDIPVYKSRIQSLHLLFTLYNEFKNSQHFGSMEAINSENLSNTVDHLQL